MPAAGHNYKSDTTAATTKKNGNITQTCTACGDKNESKTIYAVKTVSLSKASYNYNKKAQKPTVTVKDSKGKVLRAGTDYTVSYPKGMKNVGSYTVTVWLKGNYSGTVKKEFTIAHKTTVISKVTPNKKGFSLKWKKHYVRIRTYKTVKDNGKSVKIYSGWSKAETIKTK